MRIADHPSAKGSGWPRARSLAIGLAILAGAPVAAVLGWSALARASGLDPSAVAVLATGWAIASLAMAGLLEWRLYRPMRIASRRAAGELEALRQDLEQQLLAHQADLAADAPGVVEPSEAWRLASEALGDALEALATGDLSIRIRDPFGPGLDQLLIDFNAAIESLGRVTDSMYEATEAVTFGASELSRAAERLSSFTEQQASLVRESSTVLERLHGEVVQNTGKAREVLEVVVAANQAAEHSTGVMASATEAMDRIKASSNQIEQISTVIDEIALQTNLLALNAGIEAAHAGDAGRGFAVVASEVRILAQRSAAAAREIKALVIRDSAEVAAGASQVHETSQGLRDIVAQVARVNDLVEGIASTSQTQAANVSEINDAVALIKTITERNAAMVAEATKASKDLAGEASSLTTSISRFKGAKPDDAAEAESRDDAMAEIDKLFG